MGVISRFALRNPMVIVLVLVLVAGSGLYSAFSLHQEAFPDISLPVVTVSTTYSGASATVVLDNVTKPLEAAISSVPGVLSLDSTSVEGISRVLATFDVGSDTHAMERAVQDAVNTVTLPTGAQRPQVALNGPSSRPILIYSLAGADVPSLTNLAQNTIAPALQALGGVASVSVLGGASNDVLVSADPAKLKQFGVTIASLDSAIKAGTAAQPVGDVSLGGVSQPVSAGSAPDSLAAIRALPIVPATAGIGGGGGSSSAGSTNTVTATVPISRAIDQAKGYLSSARADLLTFSNYKPSPNNSQPIGGGPTIGIQSLIYDALITIGTNPQNAANDIRDAQRNYSDRVLKNHPDYADNPYVSGAMSWLSLARTALTTGGNPQQVTVGDVAAVTLGTPGGSAIVHSGGHSGILLQVTRAENADTSQVAATVRAALAGMALPRGVTLTKVVDASDTIATSIGGAVREGFVGALLAVIIIGLFLRSWRATLIAVVSIPFSFLLTMICLLALGLTLNVITLAGVAVATGRVVDDSIVVIENLYRRIAHGEAVTRATILAGVVDVGAAILSSTATTICVFLPLAFVSGLVNTFFAPFSWTVAIHLIASYLCAVTIVPLMAYALFRRHVPHEAGEDRVTRAYRAALAWSLDHRVWVLAGAALTVAVGVVILRRTPSNLIPQTGPATATVSINAPVGSSVQTTAAAAARLERVIGADSDIDSYYTTIGDVNRRGLFNATTRVVQDNQGTININFKTGVDGVAAVNHLRALLRGGSYGASYEVHKTGDVSTSLELDITGSDPNNISRVTQQVEAIVRGVGGVDAITDTLAAAKPELQITVDPVRAAHYGLTAAAVVQEMQALIGGATVAHVTLGGTATDVFASLNTAAMTSTASLDALALNAGTLTLGQVATVQPVNNVQVVTRHDQQLASKVTGVITAANVGGTSGKIGRRVKRLHLPGDTAVVLAGVSQQQTAAFTNVYNSMMVAVVLVFIVMVLAFRTLAAPVAILFSLPVTAIGAALGLLLGQQTLGLPALIGGLMLIGIVVTNAIVLMTRVQQFRAAGATTRQALLDAGVNRLRPIVMTAMATIGALVPLALGLAEGNLISQSLADTVIGGLISSTVLTLVIVPVVFSLLVPKGPVALDVAEAAA